MGVKRYVRNIEKLNLDESTHKKKLKYDRI